jgi:hypothetical protein
VRKKTVTKILKNRIFKGKDKELNNSIVTSLLNSYLKVIGYVEDPELIYDQHKNWVIFSMRADVIIKPVQS